MKKSLLSLVTVVFLLSVSGLAQELNLPYLHKQNLKLGKTMLKMGVVGSYPRHTEEYQWDNDWVPSRTIETSYTSNGDPAVIEYNANGSLTRDVFSYNDMRLPTEVLHQGQEGGVWVNQNRTVSSYNSQGYETENRSEQWNGTGWALTAGTQSDIQMDGDRVSVVTSRTYDTGTSTWVNSVRETYSYGQSGNDFASVVTEAWENGAWANQMKTDYTWENDQPTLFLTYDWSDGSWSLSSKTVIEYQDFHSSVWTTSMSIGENMWMESSRITFTYDSHGNETLTQIEMYLGSWMIVTAAQYLLTYSGDNLTQRITQSYSIYPPEASSGNTTVTWNNQLKEVFSNFASLGTHVSLMPEDGISVFPNPAGRSASIRLSVPAMGPVTLTLYTLNGQELRVDNLTSSGSDILHQMNLDGIRPGSYILVARDHQGKEIGKTRLIKE
jgi:hypothetical protein